MDCFESFKLYLTGIDELYKSNTALKYELEKKEEEIIGLRRELNQNMMNYHIIKTENQKLKERINELTPDKYFNKDKDIEI